MRDVTLPLCEMGPAPNTRDSVQKYYDTQRNLGVEIREAIIGTEHALHLKDLKVSPDGKVVESYYNQAYLDLDEDNSPAAFAKAINATTERMTSGYMSHASWKSHTISLWGSAKAAGVLDAVRKLVTDNGAKALAYKVK